MTQRTIARFLLPLFLFLTAAGGAAAADRTETLLKQAAQAYAQKDYAKAATAYDAVLASQAKAIAADSIHHDDLAAVYYNLGNCHYRLKDMAHAVLNYQRALRYAPDNDDIRFNLELTRTKLADKFDDPSEMFFVTWARELVQSESAACWLKWCFFFLALACIALLAFLFAPKTAVRKAGFFAAIAMVVLTATTGLFSAMQHHSFTHYRLMVVMKETSARTSPSATAREARKLHEGTTLRLTNSDEKQWLAATLPDGTEVWIEKSAAEAVSNVK